MPYSDPDNKPWTAEKIKEINPKTVLDVGAGAGVYVDIIRRDLGIDVWVEAVEAWEPNIKDFNLNGRYNAVHQKDVREMEEFNYDLVIFGDVLEHMLESESIELWNKVGKQAKHAIISIPIIHYHQEAVGGNPYEVHVEEDWDAARVLKSFYGIKEHKLFDVTGVFVAEFYNNANS
jgi:hypothetical protein